MTLFDAYTAGYFDAEGCVRVNNDNAQRAVSFGQVRPAAVLALYKRYPGGRLYLRKQDDKRRRKLIWALLTEEGTRDFLLAIQPHVIEKRTQLEAALTFHVGMPRDQLVELACFLQTEKRVEIDKGAFPWSVRVNQHKKLCKEPDCGRPARGRGFCSRHYQRQRLLACAAGSWQPQPRTKPFEYKRVPTEAERSYLAGYFDGDGHLELTKERIGIKFGQTNGGPCQLIHSLYGGYMRPKDNDQGWRLQVTYALETMEAVRQFLRDIQPFVIEKVDEVAAGLRWTPQTPELTALQQVVRYWRKEYEIPIDYLNQLTDQGIIVPDEPVVCYVCGLPATSRALCEKHRWRQRAHGDPMLIRRKVAGSWQLVRAED